MKKLIIDTDVALGVWHEGRPRDIDDGFAMVEAINSDKIDLLGVTCVFGNGPHEEVFRVAQEIVQLKQVEIPVLPGASQALRHATPNAREDLREFNPSNPAVDFLAKTLRQEKINIAAIGPLTNIGLLILHHAEVLQNIEQLIIVAGRTPGNDFFIGDTGPVADFNFENDVLAAQLIMESGIPCVLMGFELTSQVVVTKEDLETIAQRKNSTAQYFYDNSIAWAEHWTKTFPGDAGFHPWDSAAIAWLLNPSWFTHDKRKHRIIQQPPRLECSAEVTFNAAKNSPQHIYCYGFQANGANAFINSVVSEVW